MPGGDQGAGSLPLNTVHRRSAPMSRAASRGGCRGWLTAIHHQEAERHASTRRGRRGPNTTSSAECRAWRSSEASPRLSRTPGTINPPSPRRTARPTRAKRLRAMASMVEKIGGDDHHRDGKNERTHQRNSGDRRPPTDRSASPTSGEPDAHREGHAAARVSLKRQREHRETSARTRRSGRSRRRRSPP